MDGSPVPRMSRLDMSPVPSSGSYSCKELENIRSLSGIDKLQRILSKRWIGEPLALQSYFSQYYTELQENRFIYSTSSQRDQDKFADAMNLNKKLIDELQAVCNIDRLAVEGEEVPKDTSEVLSHITRYTKERKFEIPTIHAEGLKKLKTLQIQKGELHSRLTKPNYKTYAYRKMKYCSIERPQKLSMGGVEKKRNGLNCVAADEFVLTCRVYRPACDVQDKKINFPRYEQQIDLIGCNKLTELRDKIQCVSDIAIEGDFSIDPDKPQNVVAKDLCKSGFFYFHGTFYNDMRDDSNTDYSEVIMKWAETAPGVLPFKKALMEGMRFRDLTLRLGMPYLYMHQGNCEHLVVFTDARLIRMDDPQEKSAYPRFTSVSRKHPTTCMICNVYIARWVTTENIRVPEDPFFFCDKCFRYFNYEANSNRKIGSFKAQPFFDRNAIM